MDIITVGGVTIDAFLQLEKGNDVVHLDREAKEVHIQSGAKVEVDSCTFSLGGNACNVAVGMSRLGFSAGLCAEMGDDEFAQKISNGLDTESVSKEYIIKKANGASSFAIALNVEAERTLFVEHVIREHHFDLSNLQAKWMYITSIGETWKDAYTYLATIVKEKNITLIYSPGTHQLAQASNEVANLFPLAHVLCVNKEEASRIVKFYKNQEVDDIKGLFAVLSQMSPHIISITDGPNGGYAKDTDGSIWQIEKFPQDVVERTGAGDAYATGFAAAIMSEKSVAVAMQYGSINAASVVGTIGAQKGLLSKEEIEKKLTQHPEFQAKKI